MSVVRDYPTPQNHLVKIAMRPDTADEPVIVSTSAFDEYGTRDYALRPGDLFVDIGAYVGSVGLTVATDYPEARVVMVEAVPENCEVIRESIEANGFGDRVTVYHAAASCCPGMSDIHYGAEDTADAFQRSNRFVGNLMALDDTRGPKLTVPNLTLEDIVNEHGNITWLKIDCEGCEYGFLDSVYVANVREMVGELHKGQDRLLELLIETHDVDFYKMENDYVGMFRASRRG